MRKINRIIVHCSATKPNWMQGATVQAQAEEIRRWHVQDNGWSDIGYHYLIGRDGAVAEGRPVETVGAHVRGHNADSIGICLIGGFGSNASDSPDQHFTQEQLDALRALIERLRGRFGPLTVHGHNEFAAKACPGFNVAAFMAEKRRTSVAKSRTIQATVTDAATKIGAGASAVAMLDGRAQLVALGIVAFGLVLSAIIFRERLKAWAEGWR